MSAIELYHQGGHSAKGILNSIAARITDGRGLSPAIQQEYLREINAFYGITEKGQGE